MLSSPCVIRWGIYTISNIYPEFRLAERFLERTTVLWKSCLFWNVFINLIKRLHSETSNQLLMDKKMLFPIIFVTLIPTHSALSLVLARAAVHAAAASGHKSPFPTALQGGNLTSVTMSIPCRGALSLHCYQ